LACHISTGLKVNNKDQNNMVRAIRYGDGEHPMPLSKERILTIESLTVDLLREAYGESEDIIPPVNLNKIVEKAGLTIMTGEVDNPNMAGSYDRKERLIVVKKSDPWFRKVFTIAHELGHYYLHTNKPSEIFYRQDLDFLVDDAEKDQEQEANWFAASLLMPKTVLIRFWMVIRDIDELAKRFGVSSTACYYRLKNLGMI
jgi:Zn-dependent peptidase ImmA (M78 family)